MFFKDSSETGPKEESKTEKVGNFLKSAFRSEMTKTLTLKMMEHYTGVDQEKILNLLGNAQALRNQAERGSKKGVAIETTAAMKTVMSALEDISQKRGVELSTILVQKADLFLNSIDTAIGVANLSPKELAGVLFKVVTDPSERGKVTDVIMQLKSAFNATVSNPDKKG